MSEILFALLPMAILVISMGICKWPGDKSSLFTLIITILLAIFIFKAPVQEIGTTLLNSSYRACVTILSVIWIAVFSYNLLLHSGKIEILKGQLAAISTDKSVQVLLITWGFGGLLEGMAGYGTSVAIPAAILVTLGFRPLFAVLVSLIANSEPTTFGAVGIAETVLAEETGCPLPELCKATIQQLFPFIFLIPITLTILADRRRQALPKNLLLGTLVGGVSYLAQYLTANYLGPETPAIIGSICSIIAIIIWSHFHPSGQKSSFTNGYTARQIYQAWSIYGFIILFILLAIPFHFKGTALLLLGGAFIGGQIQGVKTKKQLVLLGKTLVQIRTTIIMVIALVGISALMEISGMIRLMADTLTTLAGNGYAFWSPLVGEAGTFLTGSGTSANILFGKLQVGIAENINVEPSWLTAANTTGTTAGKIISPQSIAIAASACQLQGKEGEILKQAFPYALVYGILLGIIVALGS
ncbi:L-lactate permease [Butyricimonas paravirosa]|uniref:L-lactate permease n=1 Tax=Butyricimonas paravirosa TaxID=1472417 RepID=UPI00210CDA87|nr:L-lactate permease [Butyricimonas paravirosa]MCQ4875535.1 L-lactate permease [Butyricimonas paravirosa]